MRRPIATVALLLAVAACGDSAATTTATAPPPLDTTTTTSVPATTVPPATTSTATATATTTLPPATTAPAPDLPDIDAVASCDELVDAALLLLQAVFDGLGDMSLDDLEAAGGTVPALEMMDAEGQKLDAKTEELGCDPAQLEADLVARVDELEARGPLSELILAGLTAELPEPDEAGPPEGVEIFLVDDASHTEDPVAYPQDPPVGGPHHPTWQNCGFYSEPVGTEHAVHSLEHGVVWITYDAGFAADVELDALVAIAQQPKVLVSPYAGLGDTPVVASAWGAQLRLESALDPRLEQFVAAFRDTDAPEPGAPCEGGVGDPE